MLFDRTSLITRVGGKRLRNSPSLSEKGVFLPVEKNVAEGEPSVLFIAAGFSVSIFECESFTIVFFFY